jgi:NAD(P)-dependent dehydrogenase (short-subunit alcohol dehydrogenase family)
MSLAGRTILITGAGRGLGRAFAEACAAAHADRIVVADVNCGVGRGDRSAALTEAGAKACLIPGRPRRSRSRSRPFAEKMTARYGHLDGLVNNGAIATGIGGKTFEEIDIETWDRVMAVNVRGTVADDQAMAPLLPQVGSSAAASSISRRIPRCGARRGCCTTSAARGAVISMTRSLARELGPTGSPSMPSRRPGDGRGD